MSILPLPFWFKLSLEFYVEQNSQFLLLSRHCNMTFYCSICDFQDLDKPRYVHGCNGICLLCEKTPTTNNRLVLPICGHICCIDCHRDITNSTQEHEAETTTASQVLATTRLSIEKSAIVEHVGNAASLNWCSGIATIQTKHQSTSMIATNRVILWCNIKRNIADINLFKWTVHKKHLRKEYYQALTIVKLIETIGVRYMEGRAIVELILKMTDAESIVALNKKALLEVITKVKTMKKNVDDWNAVLDVERVKYTKFSS